MSSTFSVRSLRWDITKNCNLSCLHCYAISEHQNDLCYAEVVKIIEKLIPLGLEEVNLSGREPTLRKDLIDIVRWCKKRSLIVNITTNGTVLDSCTFSELLKTNIDLIVFSLDGASEFTHEKIRGKGTYNKVIESIKICRRSIKADRLNSKIGVSFTLQKVNANECSNIVQLCNFLEVDILAINPVSFCGSAIINKELLHLSPTDVLNCWDRICAEYKKNSSNYELYLGTFPMEAKFLNAKYNLQLPVIHTGCSAGKTIYINPSGAALPCYMLPSIAEEVPYLNRFLVHWYVLDESLEEAHQKFKPFIDFAGNYSQKENKSCITCPDIDVCKRCPLIAISDQEAIARCQLAWEHLNSLTIEQKPDDVWLIRNCVNWAIRDNILSISIDIGGYSCEKKFELNQLARSIWFEITKGVSINDLKTNIEKQWGNLDEIELHNCINEFLDYFWKEGIIARNER